MNIASTRRRIGPLGWLLRIVAGLVALLMIAVGTILWLARPATPDAFYAAPATVPSQPGALLRSEPFTRAVPAGARAWRILYTTTRIDGRPAVASAIVLVSATPSTAPRPVIAWAHGTTGVVPGCAPSVLADPFLSVPAVPQLIAEGWAFVAADYVGLGTQGHHAYLVGEDAARAVLDAVRAARTMDDVRLDNRTVVWGHSQGGHAALWTGIAAPNYARDVPLAGVAALAPATDLSDLIRSAQTGAFGKVVSAYLVHAYEKTYADVKAADYLRPGIAWLARDIAGRCLGGLDALVLVAEAMMLPRDGIFARPPSEGALGAHLLDNVPRRAISAPVLLGQGEADDLILPAVQERYAQQQCRAGTTIDHRSYAGRDHITLLAQDSPLIKNLMDWTRDRFSGRRAPTTSCAPS